MNNEQTNRRVELAMNSLDNLQRVEANPFLYGKIRQRMTGEAGFAPVSRKWVLGFAAVFMLLVLANLYSFSSFMRQPAASGSTTGIESFSNYYEIHLTGDNI